MTETVKDLKDLGSVADAAPAEEAKADAPEGATAEKTVAPKEPKLRRKESVARVWLTKGKGQVIINGKSQEQYFGRQTHLLVLNQPFLIVDRVNGYDVVCTVKGGGQTGQAGAVRHGISRALENMEPELRPALKKAGMLTRDARVVERKKIGKHKARRSKQWAKR